MKPMSLGFAGCVRVSRKPDGTPTCALAEPRQLRIAAPSSLHAVNVYEEVGASRSRIQPLPGSSKEPSSLLRVTLSPRAERVVVEADSDDVRDRRRFTLRIAAAPSLPWLETAREARTRGDFAGARAALADHAEAPDALSLLARIQLAEGHANEAFPTFERAIAAHRSEGRLSDAIDDTFALAFALHQRSHRYEEAKAALDSLTPLLAFYPEGAAREPYYRAVLAGETGDHRAAISMLDQAMRRASSLGLEKLERLARSALALEHLALAQANKAKEALVALERDSSIVGCERAEVLNNLGWLELSSSDNPSRLEEARRWLEGSAASPDCADSYVTSFALTNLARVAIEQGRIEEASKQLANARSRVREPRGTERIAWIDLEGRIALARQTPHQALMRFDEALTLSSSLGLLDSVWSAHVGRAEALVDKGDLTNAIRALESAEEALDRASLFAPLGGGRSGYVALRDKSARLAVTLLVQKRRPELAARIAERSIGRLLRPVAQALRVSRFTPDEYASWTALLTSYRAAREGLELRATRDWTLSTAELVRTARAREEEEHQLRERLESSLAGMEQLAHRSESEAKVAANQLDVIVHPTRQAWVVLLRDSTRTTAEHLPPPALPEGPQALIRAVAQRLTGKTRVRVLTYGAYRSVDLHSLSPLQDDAAPLLANVEVTYAPGLGSTVHAPNESMHNTAIVVGDPTGDLPQSREESMAVATALAPHYPSVTRLIGSDVTHHALAEMLPTADWLHYGGHAAYAGIEGLESSLPLAERGRFSVEDVLALPRVPRVVVLGACNAARNEGGAEGLGLAQAFLAAGSERVLAPTRPVPDGLAASLARALYAATDASIAALPTDDLVARTRSAILRLRAENPSSDWSAYRVLMP